jgi:hypothetical protein
MSGQPVAERFWSGWLRVTAPITPEQKFEFISDVVREAVYFDFEGEHPDHGAVDLSVGLCDDPVVEGGSAVLQFPTIVTVFDTDLVIEDVPILIAGMVRERIDGGVRGSREVQGELDRDRWEPVGEDRIGLTKAIIDLVVVLGW